MRLVILLMLSSFISGQTYQINQGYMKFLAIANTVGIESDLIGEGNGLSGTLDLDAKTFRFVYDLWKIDTGIELRNDHMHENYLETEDYPEAVFSGSIITFDGENIQVKGTFELHGETNEIIVNGIIKDGKLKASWKLDLNDYKIDIPERFLIAKMNQVLDMEIDVKLEEKQ